MNYNSAVACELINLILSKFLFTLLTRIVDIPRQRQTSSEKNDPHLKNIIWASFPGKLKLGRLGTAEHLREPRTPPHEQFGPHVRDQEQRLWRGAESGSVDTRVQKPARSVTRLQPPISSAVSTFLEVGSSRRNRLSHARVSDFFNIRMSWRRIKHPQVVVPNYLCPWE